MRFSSPAIIGGLCLILSGCQAATANDKNEVREQPMAKIIPHRLEKHGHVRIDNYYWLNQRDNPGVLEYLQAENEYTSKVMAPARDLEEKLFEEIKGRIKQTDMSVPYKKDGYYYYTRYEEGKEYPIHCRKKESLEAPEEVMIDANVLAEGHEYFAVGGRAVSSAQDILAYATDTLGRRIYTIAFKNLDTGEFLEDMIPAVTGNMAWANDNRTLFYSRQDPTTLRSYQIYRHVLGTDPAQDELVLDLDTVPKVKQVNPKIESILVQLHSARSLGNMASFAKQRDMKIHSEIVWAGARARDQSCSKIRMASRSPDFSRIYKSSIASR